MSAGNQGTNPSSSAHPPPNQQFLAESAFDLPIQQLPELPTVDLPHTPTLQPPVASAAGLPYHLTLQQLVAYAATLTPPTEKVSLISAAGLPPLAISELSWASAAESAPDPSRQLPVAFSATQTAPSDGAAAALAPSDQLMLVESASPVTTYQPSHDFATPFSSPPNCPPGMGGTIPGVSIPSRELMVISNEPAQRKRGRPRKYAPHPIWPSRKKTGEASLSGTKRVRGRAGVSSSGTLFKPRRPASSKKMRGNASTPGTSFNPIDVEDSSSLMRGEAYSPGTAFNPTRGETSSPGTAFDPMRGDTSSPRTSFNPMRGETSSPMRGEAANPGTTFNPMRGEASNPGTAFNPMRGEASNPGTAFNPMRGEASNPGSAFNPMRGEAASSGTTFFHEIPAPGFGIKELRGHRHFTPHVVHVEAGKDITAHIVQASQRRTRAISILSASGSVSEATLYLSGGGTVTYKGRFTIIALSGSLSLTPEDGEMRRAGGISLLLARPDGNTMGGTVAGVLTAATPVQVVVCTFHEKRSKLFKLPQPVNPSKPRSSQQGPVRLSPLAAARKALDGTNFRIKAGQVSGRIPIRKSGRPGNAGQAADVTPVAAAGGDGNAGEASFETPIEAASARPVNADQVSYWTPIEESAKPGNAHNNQTAGTSDAPGFQGFDMFLEDENVPCERENS